MKNREQSLNELLRMHRDRAKPRLTQRELASQIGITDKAVRDWENGISLPSAINLRKLIEIFLTAGLFTLGKELAEAQLLWDIRREADFTNNFPTFDKARFENLLKQRNPLESLENEPLPSVEEATSNKLATRSRTLTFLFTDIEGSTALWEKQTEAMQAAVEMHDKIIREAIGKKGGKVFKTSGDAFCAIFTDPLYAIQAALLIQQNLQEADWGSLGSLKVRIALHTGVADERDGDFFGPTLNRVGRLLSVGHGGQILVSATSAELVRDRLPQNLKLEDLHRHYLKDLTRPEQIFQLAGDGLPDKFPPLKTSRAISTNLPIQLTSFIGREKEKAELKVLLQNTRLLTLLGAGGVGKTRLALQLGTEVLENYPDGVKLVELAGLNDPALLPQTVATSLGIAEIPGQPVLVTLQQNIANQQLLLILDNCEHLIEASANFVDTALKNCPDLQILVTSRERLGITGETVWRVPSLDIPDPQRLPCWDELLDYPSVKLFVERVQQVRPDFKLTEENATDIAQICYKLDGIALALELAAARASAMNVKEIATRLDDRFRVLSSGSRTALPRQKTLRTLIDWSYDLLNEQEKVLFARLAIFPGGWFLEAAEQICAGPYLAGEEQLDELDIFDLQTRLIDKSLVNAFEESFQMRYRLLETIRQYGLEKLKEQAEYTQTLNQFCEYYTKFAMKAELELSGENQKEWLEKLEREQDNFRVALTSLLEKEFTPSKVLLVRQLGGALARFWMMRGSLNEGDFWLEKILSLPLVDAGKDGGAALAKVYKVSGAIAFHRGRAEEARRDFEQSLELTRELDDKLETARLLNNLGIIARELGDQQEARSKYEECVLQFRLLNDQPSLGIALNNLGLVARDQGDYASARRYLEEGLSIKRQLKDNWGMAYCLSSLGDVSLDQGDLQAARTYLTEGLRLYRELNDRRGLALLLGYFAGLAAAEAKPALALRLGGAAAAIFEAIGAVTSYAEQALLDRRLEQARIALDTPQQAALWQEGLNLNEEQAVELAQQV